MNEYIIKNYDKVKISSQNIKKDDIFIALQGNQHHGNEFIKDAIDKGARYIVTDKQLTKKFLKPNIIVVEDIFDYLSRLAKKKRSLYKGKVIGVTGSIGKTSVKENLNFFLSSNFKVFASIKSYNNYLGTIVSLLNLDLSSDFAIFEIGTNNFLEIRNLASIVLPSQVIITNIYPTHLEKLINTKKISEEKSDIFNLKYNSNVKLAILGNNNIDERRIIKKAQKLQAFEIMTFGKGLNSNIIIDKIKKIDNLEMNINVICHNKKINFTIDQNQLHRINNFLICLLVFIYNKINLKHFLLKTREVPLIEGRGLRNEIIYNGKKIYLIDESYNASPQTMKNCIDYFDQLKTYHKQKKILILGEMKELGDLSIRYHKDIINYLSKKKLKNVIICGYLMKISLEKKHKDNIKYMLDKKSILNFLKKTINHEDILLIKGSNSAMTNDLANFFLKKGNK